MKQKLDAALSELPSHDVDAERSEHIFRTAVRELGARESPAGAQSKLRWTYDWVLEPALVVGFGAVYIGWAIQIVATIKGL